VEALHAALPDDRWLRGVRSRAPPTLDIGRRTGIGEVETGYGRDDARRQGALLGLSPRRSTTRKCVLCSRCVDVCPEYCLAIVPFGDLDLGEEDRATLAARADAAGLPLSAMVKDDDRCIRCGLCAIRCPTDAMTMERFQITEQLTFPAPGGRRARQKLIGAQSRREIYTRPASGRAWSGSARGIASLGSLVPTSHATRRQPS
jgi:ferredoxin